MKISKIVSAALLSVAVTSAFANAVSNDEKIVAAEAIKGKLETLLKTNATADKFGAVDAGANLEAKASGISDALKEVIPNIEKLGLIGTTFDLGEFQGENIKVGFETNKITLITTTKDGAELKDEITLNADQITYKTADGRTVFDYLYDDDTVTTDHKSAAAAEARKIKTDVKGSGLLADLDDLKLKDKINFAAILGGDYAKIAGLNAKNIKDGAEVNKIFNGVEVDKPANKAINDIFTYMDTAGFTADKAVKFNLNENGTDYIEFKKTSAGVSTIKVVKDGATDTFTKVGGTTNAVAGAVEKGFVYNSTPSTESAIAKLEKLSEADNLEALAAKEKANLDLAKAFLKLSTDKILDLDLSELKTTEKGKEIFDGTTSNGALDSLKTILGRLAESSLTAPIEFDLNDASNQKGAKIKLERIIDSQKGKITIISDSVTDSNSPVEDTITGDSSGIEAITTNDKPAIKAVEGFEESAVKAAIVNKVNTEIAKKDQYIKESSFLDNIPGYVSTFFSSVAFDGLTTRKAVADYFANSDTGGADEVAGNLKSILTEAANLASDITDFALSKTTFLDIKKQDADLNNKASITIKNKAGDKSVTIGLNSSGTDLEVKDKTDESVKLDTLITSLKDENLEDKINREAKEKADNKLSMATFFEAVKTTSKQAVDAFVGSILDVNFDGNNKDEIKNNIESAQANPLGVKAKAEINAILEKAKDLNTPVSFTTEHGVTITLANEGGKGVLKIKNNNDVDTFTETENGNFTYANSVASGNDDTAVSALNKENLKTDLVAIKANAEALLALYTGANLNENLPRIVNPDYSKVLDKASGEEIILGKEAHAQKDAILKLIDAVTTSVGDEKIVIDNIASEDGLTIELSKTGIAFKKDGKTDTITKDEKGTGIKFTTDKEQGSVIGDINKDHKADIINAVNKKMTEAKANAVKDRLADEALNVVAKLMDPAGPSAVQINAAVKALIEKSKEVADKILDNTPVEFDLTNDYKVKVAKDGTVAFTNGTKTDTFVLKDGEVEATSSVSTEQPLVSKISDAGEATKAHDKALLALTKLIQTLKKVDDVTDISSKQILELLTSEEKLIAQSLGDLAGKKDASAIDVLSSDKFKTRAELVEFIKNLHSSISGASENAAKAIDLDIVKFNTDLATQTRLATLANPFNADLALASAIKELSTDKFADAGNAVDSIVKEYTNRFTHDNNLWGTMLGGKARSKGGANPSIFGFTLGYDKAFDNAIVGTYLSYAKSKAKSSGFETKTDNYQLGLYNRTYFGVNELDSKLTLNFGKNKVQRNVAHLSNEGKYNSLTTSLDVDYGRVYDLSDAAYFKPFVGFSYTHLKSKSFTESGNLALNYNSVTSKSLALKAGTEFRKYISNGNYIYATPGIQSEIYKKIGDRVVRFVGSDKDIVLDSKAKKQTYFTLQTGAEVNINNNLSTNINFGTKLSKDNKFYNGTIGLRYKF